ncbi:MAG: hypothetical protein ABIY50_06905 [Ignavibacteria bacterium]
MISNNFQSLDSILTTSTSPVINFLTSVSVNTNEGTSVRNVVCSVIDPAGNILGQFNMSDSGSPPDTNSNDGRYVVTVNISNITCLLVGNYRLEYIAENNSGLFSNLITSDLRVINSDNQPPVITGTNLPDSIVRPLTDSTLLTISINVSDPNGICDLKNVTFITTRPNGIELPPIPMFYEGNGQFSFSNYVRNSSDPSSYGYFKYRFTARDNSNLLSPPAFDSIKFVQPN